MTYRRVLRLVLGAWLLAGSPWSDGIARAQEPVFDHLKCYRVKDSIGSGEYTMDLHPKDGATFAVEPGDVALGGSIQPGCRVRLPAKYFCTDVDPRNSRSTRPPFDPAQWVVDGPAAGDRLCYKLKCPSVPAKELDVVDQFGTRRITVTGRPAWLCTPLTRDLPPGTPCSLRGDGQCTGECPLGQRCLAISGEDCGCAPDSAMCSAATTCSAGLCPGVWETCVVQGTGACGCNHP
jgi:hypothetical protein